MLKNIYQTNRPYFRKRYKEHLQSFKHGNYNSKFAQHLLDNGHSFRDIQDIMTPLYYSKKGIHLNAMEKFYIFQEVKRDNHINDKCTFTDNKIFQTILNNETTC